MDTDQTYNGTPLALAQQSHGSTVGRTLGVAVAGMMKKPKVLFVCVENSCRSQMAEAFARIQGADALDVHSAGSRPSGVVNQRAIELMGELGYDLSSHRSQGLDEIPDGPYAAVVTMGCGDACPHVPASQRLDWAIPDPKNVSVSGFREIRDDLGRRVSHLLDEILAAA